MRVSIPAVAALSTLFAVSPGMAASVGSTNYQIDAAHDGHITLEKPFNGPLKRRWVRKLGLSVSYPIFANGLVFTSTRTMGAGHSELYALDAKSGETVWMKRFNGVGFAAYDTGRIFFVDGSGLVQAFKANRAGTLVWSRNLFGAQRSFGIPPMTADGRVYLIGQGVGADLYALSQETGNIGWDQFAGGGTATIPAYGDGGVYANYEAQYYKYDPITGKQIWHVDLGGDGGTFYTPVYFDDRVYVRDIVHGSSVRHSANGRLISSFAEDWTPAFWTSSQGEERGFVVNSKNLMSFDVKTGAILWEWDNADLEIPPIVINDTVVIGATTGDLYLLDASTGNQIWSKNVHAPIVNSQIGTTGFGVGDDMLFVPAGRELSAWTARQNK